jgi:glucosylceramidase
MRFSSLVLLSSPAVLAANAQDVNIDSQRAAQAFASSSDGSLKLSKVDAPVRGNGNAQGRQAAKLSINDTPSGYKQKVRGFGAAVTDSTVTVFNYLSKDKLEQLMRDLMTPAGANFALMRHTVASSDLSGNPEYSYDDNNGNPDPNLSSFNLGDRGNAMVKMLAYMKTFQPLMTILGSPWSPPGWMKKNGIILGNTVNNNINMNYADKFADYFLKYLQTYKAGGVNVDAITLQNEPLNSNAGFPTMYLYDYEARQLIQNNVGPRLRGAGLKTEIWAYDHNTGMFCSFHLIRVLRLTIESQMFHRTLRLSSLVLASMSTTLPGTAMQETTTGPRCLTSIRSILMSINT